MFSILVYRNTTDFVSWSWVLQPSWTCFFVLIVLGRFFRNSVYKTMWSAKRARFISFLPIWRPFKSFPHPTVLAWTSTMWNRNGKNRYLWLNHKALVLGFLLLFLLFPHNRGSQIQMSNYFPGTGLHAVEWWKNKVFVVFINFCVVNIPTITNSWLSWVF